MSADPDTLVEVANVSELQDMLAIAFHIYGEKTGGETMPCPQIPYPDLGDWDFEDKEEVKRRYPRLAARYS